MKPLVTLTLLVLSTYGLKAQKGELFNQYRKQLNAYNRLCGITTGFGYTTTVINNTETTTLFYHSTNNETEEATIVGKTCKIINKQINVVPIKKEVELVRVDTIYIKADTVRVIKILEKTTTIEDIKLQFSQTGFSVFKDNVLTAIVFYPLTEVKEYYLLRTVKQNVAITDYSGDSKIFTANYLVPMSWWGNNYRGVLTDSMVSYIEASCHRFF